MLEEWQTNPDNLRILKLSNRQKQTIFGTLLGSSSIIHPNKSKNPHLLMRCNKSENVNWLRCKAEELKILSRPKSFIEDETGFRWNSFSNYIFIDFKNLFYINGIKKIEMEVLDSLGDLGLCTWFLDRCVNIKNICGFKTIGYDKKSIENIIKYFNLINIPIFKDKTGYLLFKNEVISDKFLKIISHCIPLVLGSS